MSGFVALHREAFAHPVLRDAERFRAWFWLVANAAWRPTRHDARGKTIEVQRGQICAGRDHLAREWGWKPSAVERFLTRLETEQMIGRESGQGKTLITICNYDKYQAFDDEAGQISGQDAGQKSDRHRTTKEQGNKGTRETEEPNGSPVPPRTPARARPDHFPKPDWADAEVWVDFMTNRRRKRLPNTATAYRGFLGNIAELATAEWPPGRLLEYAAAKGWGSINPPDQMKVPANDHRSPTHRGTPAQPARRSSLRQAIDEGRESLDWIDRR